jgi:hypothetical protein
VNLESLLMGVLPSVGALLIFFLAVRGVIRADRNERAAIAREEAEAATAAAGAHEAPGAGTHGKGSTTAS